MQPYLTLASYHPDSATGSISHMIMSSIIHGLIYGVIWKILRTLTIPEALVLCVVVVGALAILSYRRRRF